MRCSRGGAPEATMVPTSLASTQKLRDQKPAGETDSCGTVRLQGPGVCVTVAAPQFRAAAEGHTRQAAGAAASTRQPPACSAIPAARCVCSRQCSSVEP